jgi:hypothetical protein
MSFNQVADTYNGLRSLKHLELEAQYYSFSR